MEPEVREVATAFAAERYPAADLVVVAGSAARRRRPRSDVDLLVVGPRTMFDGDADEAAFTERWRGTLLEVFASTEESFRRHQAAGVERLRPVSGSMLLEGVAVLDRGRSDALVEWTRSLLAPGPRIDPVELDARRYGVTNALDDLLDAEGVAERAVLAAALFVRVAEFALLADGRWLASGRRLLARLHDLDPRLADGLGTALATQDVARLERLTLQVLQPYGGRLLEGYVR